MLEWVGSHAKATVQQLKEDTPLGVFFYRSDDWSLYMVIGLTDDGILVVPVSLFDGIGVPVEITGGEILRVPVRQWRYHTWIYAEIWSQICEAYSQIAELYQKEVSSESTR